MIIIDYNDFIKMQSLNRLQKLREVLKGRTSKSNLLNDQRTNIAKVQLPNGETLRVTEAVADSINKRMHK